MSEKLSAWGSNSISSCTVYTVVEREREERERERDTEDCGGSVDLDISFSFMAHG